jgi:large subunit ribosomal protein L27
MAHKKAGGSTKTGRDSISKRLGVKKFGSEAAKAGNILVKQRGTKFHAGSNVKRVGDDSLIAMVDGVVSFKKKKVIAFTGNLDKRTFVSIIPTVEVKVS